MRKLIGVLGAFMFSLKLSAEGLYISSNHFPWLAAIILALIVLGAILWWNFYYLRRIIARQKQKLEAEITTRLTAQNQLHDAQEFLEAAVTGAGLGIWSWDIRKKTVSFNNVGKVMLGYDPYEIRDDRETILDLMHPVDRDVFITEITDHVLGKTDDYEGVLRMKKKNGEWKWILAKAKARERDDRGIAVRLTGIHLDIDELKQKEDALILLSEELMRNNKDLRHFSYAISHNMRAPVANIKGLLALMDRKILSQEQELLISKLEKCADELMMSMQDITNILNAKSVSSKNGDWVGLRKSVESLLDLNKDMISEVGAKVRVHVSDDERIWYPRDVFDGIALNLLSNAIKFRDNARTLVIDIFSSEDEKFIYMHVRDNGR